MLWDQSTRMTFMVDAVVETAAGWLPIAQLS